MKKVYLYFLLLAFVSFEACRNDESYKQGQVDPLEPADISVMLAGRIGSVVGDSLSQYIGALNLLLFRENNAGDYVLYRQRTLNKDELRNLSDGDKTSEAGFTVFKEVSFDTVPVANYRIVGVGNALDSTGNALPNVSLQNVTIGTQINDVLVAVRDGDEASRLFWGITETIRAGAEVTELPVLRLYRKVAMFDLTLLKIPDVVSRIDMVFGNTYASFNMAGDYTAGRGITVYGMNEYTQQVNDSIQLSYIMLPTVEGDSTSILATFYLSGGVKQPVTLPEYVLAPNTITKVTATIDTDQSGNVWKVDVTSLITVDIEWNVDQEPPINI